MKRTLLFGCASLLTLSAIAYAQVPGVNSTLNAVFNLVYDNATEKATFAAAFNCPPGTSATDLFELRGSATKKIKVRRVKVNGSATAAQAFTYIIAMRTANAGGTVGTGSIVPINAYDSSSPTGQTSATATLELWSVNPTEPATSNQIVESMWGVSNLTTGVQTQPPVDFLWGAGGNTPVLRGAAQALVFNMNGTTPSGVIMTCQIEWTEE